MALDKHGAPHLIAVGGKGPLSLLFLLAAWVVLFAGVLLTVANTRHDAAVVRARTHGTSRWTIVPSPTENDLNALDTASPTSAWAVGEAGTILEYNGAAWMQRDAVTDVNLLDVSAVSESDAWAVGEAGTILHFDGSGWSMVSSPVTHDLYGVDASSPSNVWAVGEAGTILHFDGSGWSRQSISTAATLRDVSVVGDAGWAVGSLGTILEYVDGDWMMWAQRAPLFLQAVYFDGNDGIIGGGGCTPDLDCYNVLFRLVGGSWIEEDPPLDLPIVAVTKTGSIAWLLMGVMGGAVFQSDGEGWVRQSIRAPHGLEDIAFVSPSVGWVVAQAGNIYRYEEDNGVAVTPSPGATRTTTGDLTSTPPTSTPTTEVTPAAAYLPQVKQAKAVATPRVPVTRTAIPSPTPTSSAPHPDPGIWVGGNGRIDVIAFEVAPSPRRACDFLWQHPVGVCGVIRLYRPDQCTSIEDGRFSFESAGSPNLRVEGEFTSATTIEGEWTISKTYPRCSQSNAWEGRLVGTPTPAAGRRPTEP